MSSSKAGHGGLDLDLNNITYSNERKVHSHPAKATSLVNLIQYLNMKVTDNTPHEYISAWAQNTRGLNNLLNTSRGRDKFC